MGIFWIGGPEGYGTVRHATESRVAFPCSPSLSPPLLNDEHLAQCMDWLVGTHVYILYYCIIINGDLWWGRGRRNSVLLLRKKRRWITREKKKKEERESLKAHHYDGEKVSEGSLFCVSGHGWSTAALRSLRQPPLLQLSLSSRNYKCHLFDQILFFCQLASELA